MSALHKNSRWLHHLMFINSGKKDSESLHVLPICIPQKNKYQNVLISNTIVWLVQTGWSAAISFHSRGILGRYKAEQRAVEFEDCIFRGSWDMGVWTERDGSRKMLAEMDFPYYEFLFPESGGRWHLLYRLSLSLEQGRAKFMKVWTVRNLRAHGIL